MSFFTSLFGKSQAPDPPSIAGDERIYAVGDIHGRADLLDLLFIDILKDQATRPAVAATRLIFLGDYIDRGPASRQVVEKLIALDEGEEDVIFLMGNHEEMLLAALDGDAQAMSLLDRSGGDETLFSYGVDRERYNAASADERIALARAAIPESHYAWLAGLADAYANGDYLFVHAGIRPGIALDKQSPSDLRWIRREFLEYKKPHALFVVHGHSICTEVGDQPNRLGIDTGAYQSGVLTAVGLEGDQRWFVQTRAD